MSPTKLSVILPVLTALLTLQCEPGDEPDFKPVVETGSASDVTFYSATVSASVLDDRGEPLTIRGLCWGMKPDPTPDREKLEAGNSLGQFSAHLRGLIPGTEYFFRAYAVNAAGITFGESISFKTQPNPFIGRWKVISRTQQGCDIRDNVEMLPDGLPNGTTSSCCITMVLTETRIEIEGYNASPGGTSTYKFLSGNEDHCVNGKCLTYVQLEYGAGPNDSQNYFALDDGKLLQWTMPLGYPTSTPCTKIYTYARQ